MNADLKKQYDKLTQTKSELEKKLQAAIEEKQSQAQVVPVAPLPAAAPAIKPVLIAPAQVARPLGGLKALPAPVPVQEDKPAELILPPKKN